MKTRSVKSSQVSAFGFTSGEADGDSASPSSGSRHGPALPNWSHAEDAPGPPLNRKVTGRGRHTSSSAVALRLDSPAGRGWVIDTPGLRSFGLGHMSPGRVVRAFPDLAGAAAACPPGCTHLEEACALDDWVREHGGEARLDSLRRLLRSREGADE